jgi:hypothetical protein
MPIQGLTGLPPLLNYSKLVAGPALAAYPESAEI